MTDQPTLLPWPASLTTGVFVPGTPIPQGSMRGFVVQQRVVLTQANKKLNPWRADIHTTIAGITGRTIPHPTGPVTVTLEFVMPRRVSEPKRVTPQHFRKPDLDRLIRAVLDALTGLVYTDDAQVNSIHSTKRTAAIGETPGVTIRWAATL